MNHSEHIISLFHSAINEKDIHMLKALCKQFGIVSSLRQDIWKIILDFQPLRFPTPLNLKITEKDVPPIVNKLISVIDQSKRVDLIKDSYSIATALIKPSTSPNFIPTVLIALVFHYLYPNESSEFRLGAVDAFIKRFQPFYRSLFPSIQKGLFCLLHILLQYHDPEVCHWLDSFRLEPVMYTNRYFYDACFPTGESLKEILILWDEFLICDNVYFCFYCIVSYLMQIRTDILREKKKDELITTIKTKRISTEEMRIVICRAHALEGNTSTSFKLLLKACYYNEPMFQNWYQQSLGMTLALPLEINSLVSDMKKGMKIIFIDCRTSEMYAGGYIGNAIHFDYTQRENEKYLQQFYNKKEIVDILKNVNQYHVVLYGLGEVGKTNNNQTPTFSELSMILLDFIKRGMKRVGVLLSGYTLYHRLAMNKTPGFEITKHVSQNCPICTPPELAKLTLKLNEGKKKITEKASSWFSSISSSFISDTRQIQNQNQMQKANKEKTTSSPSSVSPKPQQSKVNVSVSNDNKNQSPKQQTQMNNTVQQNQNLFLSTQPVQQQPVKQTPNLLDILNTPVQPTQSIQQQPTNRSNLLFDVQEEPMIDVSEMKSNPIMENSFGTTISNEGNSKLTFEEEYDAEEDDIDAEDTSYFDELLKESPNYEGDYSNDINSQSSNWKKCIVVLSSVFMLILDKSNDSNEMFVLDEISYSDIEKVEPQQNNLYIVICNDKKIILRVHQGNEFFNELNTQIDNQ